MMSFPCRLHASAVSRGLAPPGIGPKEKSRILLPYRLHLYPTLDSARASLSNLSTGAGVVDDNLLAWAFILFLILITK